MHGNNSHFNDNKSRHRKQFTSTHATGTTLTQQRALVQEHYSPSHKILVLLPVTKPLQNAHHMPRTSPSTAHLPHGNSRHASFLVRTGILQFVSGISIFCGTIRRCSHQRIAYHGGTLCADENDDGYVVLPRSPPTRTCFYRHSLVGGSTSQGARCVRNIAL